MHSHLITFTGPITTTYSQIAPNLLPSPDCSPEPKVGNTTSCTTTQIYPWGIAGFPAEPTPSRVPRAVSRAPPPPPTPVAEARGQDFPSRISGGSGWSFPSLVPSGPFHHPCGATPAKLPWPPACWFSRKPWQAGQGKGRGGVSAEVSSHCPHSSFSSPLLLQDANPSTRPGGAQPLPPLSIHRLSRPLLSVHLSRYPTPPPDTPVTHAFCPSSNGQLACRPHIHVAHTWDAPSHPQGIHLEALLFPALQSLLCDPPASWHTIRLLLTCVPSLPQDYTPEDRGPHPSVHHAVLSTEPRAWHLGDTR